MAATWANICQLIKYADTSSELNYQKSIIVMVLETGLGWQPAQISEQKSLTLGSTNSLVPDIILKKDDYNTFIVEMKEASHIKRECDIAQLISYMKQLETPIGVYIGNEIEVYFKNLGDGSEPLCILSLAFNPNDENGEEFIKLFSEKSFSIKALKEYAEYVREKAIFESEVQTMFNEISSQDFINSTLQDIIHKYYSIKGFDSDVISETLSRLSIKISLKTDSNCETNIPEEVIKYSIPRKRSGGNQGTAQRFAYCLVKAIIDKHPNYNFQQLYNIFGRKNYIEELSKMKDKLRWCHSEEDIIRISDGTEIVVSNQWGFNNHCKPKMDRLRKIASQLGIDSSLPF